MNLDEFRELVKAEFGDRLAHATPANVREFIDRIEGEILSPRTSNRIIIDEPCNSYEEVMKDFFSQILELPPEESMIALWTLALDLAFATVESQYADRLSNLFRDCE